MLSNLIDKWLPCAFFISFEKWTSLDKDWQKAIYQAVKDYYTEEIS